MKPLIKYYFEWKEPKDYLRLKDKHELPQTLRLLPLLFLFVFSLLMLEWWLRMRRGKPHQPFGQFAVVAVFGSAFLTYGVAWITMKCPSYVKVRDTAIFRTRGRSTLQMEFKKLESFRWIPTSKWWILRIVRRSGRHISIAVPLNLPREEIASFLEKHELRKDPDRHWSDFEDLAFLRNEV